MNDEERRIGYALMDNPSYPEHCPKCWGAKRHRYDCPLILRQGVRARRAALEVAIFEGDVSDAEYYPARDRLNAEERSARR